MSIFENAFRRARVNAVLAGRTFKKFPTHNKVGLGLGVTSLSLGVVNARNNQIRTDVDVQKASLEAKSLSALQKIHRALTERNHE